MLLVIGDSNADGTAHTPFFPRIGDDVFLQDFAWTSGGAGVNVATAAARLGGTARLLSRTGTDATAEVALAAAARSGVDLRFVQRDPESTTGVCIVLVSPGGERTFLSHRGANHLLTAPGEAVWDGVRRLHVCGHALLRNPQRATALSLVNEAGARGIPATLDLCLPVLRKYGTDLYKQFPDFEQVLMNEPELDLLAFGNNPFRPPKEDLTLEAGLQRIMEGVRETRSELGHSKPTPTLVVKLGARGSVVARPLEAKKGPLFALEAVSPFAVTAVDSTGAGDAFVAAFLLAEEAGEDLGACARFANAAGALQSSRKGSADVLPTRPEIESFLAARR